MNDGIDYKTEFAKLWLRYPDDPFKAATILYPNNTNRALRVAREWPLDPEILELKDKLVAEEGEEVFLPTKAELARSVWDKMNSDTIDADQFAKLGKLYGDVLGFIKKPDTNINTNVNNSANKVMIVRKHDSDSEWEQKLLNQQRDLTNVHTKN